MIELSDEDRAALRVHLCETFGQQHDVEQEFTPREVAIYYAGKASGIEDTTRLDFLQHVKSATFRPLNMKMHDSSAIELFTVPSQHVRGNTVREAIDAARQA